jgi:hypothetical protein
MASTLNMDKVTMKSIATNLNATPSNPGNALKSESAVEERSVGKISFLKRAFAGIFRTFGAD